MKIIAKNSYVKKNIDNVLLKHFSYKISFYKTGYSSYFNRNFNENFNENFNPLIEYLKQNNKYKLLTNIGPKIVRISAKLENTRLVLFLDLL